MVEEGGGGGRRDGVVSHRAMPLCPGRMAQELSEDRTHQNSRLVRLDRLRLAFLPDQRFPDGFEGRRVVVAQDGEERAVPAVHADRLLEPADQVLEDVLRVTTVVSVGVGQQSGVRFATGGDGSADVDL